MLSSITLSSSYSRKALNYALWIYDKLNHGYIVNPIQVTEATVDGPDLDFVEHPRGEPASTTTDAPWFYEQSIR